MGQIIDAILNTFGIWDKAPDWLGDRRGPGKPNTFVPEVVNLSIEDADEALPRCDLRMEVSPDAKQPAAAGGIVVRQAPSPGTKVRCGSLVTVWSCQMCAHAPPHHGVSLDDSCGMIGGQ